jgi:hypothetical protein
MIKFNVIDRRTYLYKGSWRNPNQDLDTPIFYYYIQPLTMALQMRQGREVIKPTATIGVYGEHRFIKGDVITLHDGMKLQVVEQTLTYYEGNIKVRHMLKPRVLETSVILE